MRLLITCEFSDGTQVLIMDQATEADYQFLTAAQPGDSDVVVLIPSRISADGPVRDRFVRAGHIRSVARESGTA